MYNIYSKALVKRDLACKNQERMLYYKAYVL